MKISRKQIAVRFIVMADIPRVSSFSGWTDEELLARLKTTDTMGMVAEVSTEPVAFSTPSLQDPKDVLVGKCGCGSYGQSGEWSMVDIVGAMVVSLEKSAYDIEMIAVDPEYRRQGVGSVLIGKLANRMPDSKRKAITSMVPEGDLVGQLFFKKLLFRAVKISRNQFVDPAEDGYLFELTLGGIKQAMRPYARRR